MDYAALITVSLAHASGSSSEILRPGQVCPLSMIHPIVVKAGELIEQSPLDAPQILAAAHQIFDRYVAPIEVPGFGRVFEPEVDSKLRDVFSILLESLADRLVP